MLRGGSNAQEWAALFIGMDECQTTPIFAGLGDTCLW